MSKNSLITKLTAFAIVLGIAIRFILLFQDPHPVDMATFNAWGHYMLDYGPSQFFDKSWTDYLPLPLYLTTLVKSLSNLTKIDFSVLFKSFFSILELTLIFSIAKKIKNKYKSSLWLIFSLLSPAFLINTSWWGQVDTLPSLLGLLSLLTLQANPILAAVIFGLAVSVKPIMLLMLPALLYVAKKNNIIKFSLISFTTFLLPALPVTLGSVRSPFDVFYLPIKFLIDKALEQASTYPYQTINGFNHWYLLGGNWKTDELTVLSVSAHTVGLVLFLFFLALLIKKTYRKNLNLRELSLFTGTTFLLFYNLATRMHERHMMFALPFIAFSLTRLKSSRVLVYFALTITYALGLYSAQYWVVNDGIWPFGEPSLTYLSLSSTLLLIVVYLSSLKLSWNNIKSNLHSNKYLVLIILLASFLRFFTLTIPEKMAFDEVYHAFTAGEMVKDNQASWEWWNTPPKGYAYEWTHPPVSKYFMVLSILIFGDNPLGWRFFSAVFGVITIYLSYLLVKEITKNHKLALLAAFLLCFEGLNISQSQIAMNDIYLISFVLATLLFAAKGKWKSSAIFFGITLATKWSGIYTLVPLMYLYLTKNKFNLFNSLNSLRLVIISIFVYLLAYYPFFEHHDFLQFKELQRQMWFYHTGLEATHDYQSTPKEWVLSTRPVWYSVNYLSDTSRSNTYAQSNPLIVWLGLLALVYSVIKKRKDLLLFGISYLIFVLPWMFSPRVMFFYHYLPSVTFLSLILADFLFNLPKKLKLSLISLVIISFLLISPSYYGYPVPIEYWDRLFKLFPSWR